MNDATKPPPFYVKDCTIASIATGIRAQSLLEFRDKLAYIDQSCIYQHFFGGRLRQTFEHWEYLNDFSFWALHHLHDAILSERLANLNPTEYDNIEELRVDLIEIVDNRLDEREIVPRSLLDEQFHFVRGKMIVFQTRHCIYHPSELVAVVPKLTRSSLFYHFIDSAVRIKKQKDDFSTWLEMFGEEYRELIIAIRKIDAYFISSLDLQRKLVLIMADYFLKNQENHL